MQATESKKLATPKIKTMNISPMMDASFKYIMVNNKDFRSLILHEILPFISIEELNHGNFENVELVLEKSNEKRKRCDLIFHCDTKHGNYYINLEANTSYYNGLFNKNNTYLQKIAIDNYKKGEKYKNKNTYIQINFNLFSLFSVFSRQMMKKKKLKQDYQYGFIYYDKEHNISLNDNTMVVHFFLEDYKRLYYNENDKNVFNLAILFLVSKTKEEMKELAEQDKLIERVVEDYMRYFLDEEGIGVYDAEVDKIFYGNTMYDNGKEEGSNEATEKTAIEMLKRNFDMKTISEITKLSLKKISELKMLL